MAVLKYWNGTTYVPLAVGTSGLDESAADARYVNISGDTLTGALTLSADPSSSLHAATKQYVDSVSNNFQPADNSFIAWTQDPRTVAASGAPPTSGTMYLAKLNIRRVASISKINYVSVTGAMTLTGGYGAIYSQDGTRQAVSNDVGTTLNSTGLKTINLNSSYTPSSAGWIWAAILLIGTTNNIVRAGNVSPFMASLNKTAATYDYAIAGTGLSTTPSSITPSSNSQVASGEMFWMAVAA